MKSFKEYLKLNESIVDQYKEVRKQARPGDQLLQQHNFDSGTDSPELSLFSHMGPLEGSVQKTPTETRPARIGNSTDIDVDTLGVVSSHVRAKDMTLGAEGVSEKNPAETSLRTRKDFKDRSVGGYVNTNSHELAHTYQQQAQIRDNSKKFGPITDSDKKILSLSIDDAGEGGLFQHWRNMAAARERANRIFGSKSRQPRLNPSFRGEEAVNYLNDRSSSPREQQQAKYKVGSSEGGFGAWSTKTRSGKRKNKRDQKIINSGILGDGNSDTPFRDQYINSDVEVNARIIGHAGEHLDFRPNLSNQDITRHMMSVADELQRHPTTKEGVRSAIETVRNQSLDAFENSELHRRSSKDSLKKSTRQYTRLIQHHESELPSDLHTEEGRSRFIASASPRSKSDLPPRYAPPTPPTPSTPREIPTWMASIIKVLDDHQQKKPIGK